MTNGGNIVMSVLLLLGLLSWSVSKQQQKIDDVSIGSVISSEFTDKKTQRVGTVSAVVKGRFLLYLNVM